VLISNFNNTNNVQGTGTTIVNLTLNGTVVPSVAPRSGGTAVTFFTSGPTGLSTALGVLQGGVCPRRQRAHNGRHVRYDLTGLSADHRSQTLCARALHREGLTVD
jgi:hypothetical protein